MKICPRCAHDKCKPILYDGVDPAEDKFFCTECGLKFKRYDEPEPEHKEYQITWHIDVTSTSPIKAAEEAFKCMQKIGTTLNCFEVEEGETRWFIDLTFPEENRKI